MSHRAKPLVLSASTITSLPITTVSDSRGQFSYTSLFSAPDTHTKDVTAGIAFLPPNTGKLCEHHHPQTEIYHILSGKGIVVINGNETEVEGGSAVFIPGGATHGIRNVSGEELRWLYVFPTDGFGEIEYTYLDKVEEGK
jgi:mannose-6-phosphate isomerase-like protein (cupin superfamily)